MKIAIDVSQIIYGTGVSVYTSELVKNLLEIDKKNEYLLFGGSLRRAGELRTKINSFDGQYESRVYFLPPSVLDILWNRLHVLPIERVVGKIDVYHSSDWAQAPSSAYKVTTIHDFAPIKYKIETHPRIVAVHERRLALVRREVDCVIVPSECTRDDAIEHGISENRIVVIPEASSKVFYPRGKEEIKRVKTQLGIIGEYLIAFGTSRRKNLGRITKAFVKLRKDQDIESLVVVGNASHNIEQVAGSVLTGHVSDDQLAALYSGAKALVFPSLYEGFGLPILQAFSCRCPVVTSKSGSMKEVAGGAAVLVDPYEVDDIKRGIEESEKNKAKLIAKGEKRAKGFSWSTTAEKTLEIYKRQD